MDRFLFPLPMAAFTTLPYRLHRLPTTLTPVNDAQIEL